MSLSRGTKRAVWLLSIVVVVITVLAVVYYWRETYNQYTETRRSVALPPFRPPTKNDKLVAELINAHNYDMRSLELGRWYLRQLKALGSDKCSAPPVKSIVDKVPGLNEVTKVEVYRVLRELWSGVCETGNPSRALDDLERVSLHPTKGLLSGMPGYSVNSSIALPL